MYRKKEPTSSHIKRNNSCEGERIEEKIERITTNKEPITDGAPLNYTEKHDGVRPEYNIRTDRFEIAAEAMDKVHKDKIAKREEALKEYRESRKPKKEEPKVENQNPEMITKSGDPSL